MGKPEPIEFRLNKWSITFDPRVADPGIVDETKKRKYFAIIEWGLFLPDLEHENSRFYHGKKIDNKFATYDEAKTWIDEQIEGEK